MEGEPNAANVVFHRNPVSKLERESPTKSQLHSPARNSSPARRESSLSPSKNLDLNHPKSPTQVDPQTSSPQKSVLEDPFQFFEFPDPPSSPPKPALVTVQKNSTVIQQSLVEISQALFEQQAHDFEDQILKLKMELKLANENFETKEKEVANHGIVILRSE
jgi:hypothetical protein